MSIKSKAVATKKFVAAHKVAIAVTATSAFWIAVNRSSLEQFNVFLKENGLYEKFYFVPEDEI